MPGPVDLIFGPQTIPIKKGQAALVWTWDWDETDKSMIGQSKKAKKEGWMEK
jgi:hypothetical protein